MRTANITSNIDTNLFKLVIKKTHIDTSIFKINKEFFVNNHSSKADLDGKYIISRLQEYYSFEENELTSMVALFLRKL